MARTQETYPYEPRGARGKPPTHGTAQAAATEHRERKEKRGAGTQEKSGLGPRPVPRAAATARGQLPGEPFRFPGAEPLTRPRPDVGPDRWPREEPATIVAPAEVVEPAVYPRPEPATPAQPRPGDDPGGDEPGDGDETGQMVAAAATGAHRAARPQPGGEVVPEVGAASVAPGYARFSIVRVGGQAFERVVVHTHWFRRGEDLAALLRRYLGPYLRRGDHAVISETAVIAVRGRMIPVEQVRPGRMAAVLARYVRPTGWGPGLSVPHKMQVAIEETGALRILAAAAAAAVTRPLGIRGVFYHVAGRSARSLDGMRPGSPYEGYVIPPLRPAEALAIARELAGALGVPVHIVDINDNGGTIRASSHPFPWRLLLAILRDNPLGQGTRCSPIGLVRAWDGPFGYLGDE